MYLIFLVSRHEKNEDGGGGEKIRIEENVSPVEVVKQLKFNNCSFLFLFTMFTAFSDSN